MATTLPPEEERFSTNVTIMAQAVAHAIRKLNQEGYNTVNPAIVDLAATIMGGFDKHYLIQGFIENSHQECWDYIKRRDEEYFIENISNVFKYLPMEHVNMFADLFRIKRPSLDENGQPILNDSGQQVMESVIEKSIKDQIWDLFDTMIKICIKYVHKGREPYSYTAEDMTVANAYNKEFYDNVDIPHHCEVWGVMLEFPASA